MLRVHFTSEDVARTVIAAEFDPLWEVLLSRFRLQERCRPVGFRPWVRALRDAGSVLIDRTGPVIVDEWLCLFGPSDDNSGADLAVLVAERERAWARFREAGIELRETYFADGARLLAFAAVESNYFYWHVRPGVPEQDWPVVIVDADLEAWYELEMSATECVYRILVGELRLDPFEDLFGGLEHHAEPFPTVT